MMNLFISLHYRNRYYGNDHYDKTDASYSRKVKQQEEYTVKAIYTDIAKKVSSDGNFLYICIIPII